MALTSGVTTQPLDVDAHLRLVEDDRSGAVTCFVGRIRNHDPEAVGDVAAISYTHHPDADRIAGDIVRRVVARLDPAGEASVAMTHRVGRLEVGDVALVCCVSTPHRELAFALCEAIVEAIKADLPIWKQQFEASGRAVWSRLGLEGDAE